ncbi:MAG: uroporphyrinogen decarboxylase/cobalamine-independent methonine synthase family protein, partial [Anaerolineae bacterium]
VSEIGHLPVMAERREAWARHNALERVRPMLLVFPEGAWRELLPGPTMRCQGDRARACEWALRQAIYHHEHLRDDTVIEPTWVVRKQVTLSNWGLEPRNITSHQTTGAWAFDPVIHAPQDLDLLRAPTVNYDAAATEREVALADDLFGDILPVTLRGIGVISFHLMAEYTALRGLEQVMVDMIADAAMLHRAMEIMESGHREIIAQYQALGLLQINNDGEYHSSGGVSYTDELPASGYAGGAPRLADLWASAEAQELAQVSPRMHAEFILPYEKRLLEPFGLNGYGCCEDLTRKMQDVLTIPHLRRVSVAPSADLARCAEQLAGRSIVSWKPQPAHLVGTFDEEMIADYITGACKVTRDSVVEFILKDTHTCESRPQRLSAWTRIASDIVSQY